MAARRTGRGAGATRRRGRGTIHEHVHAASAASEQRSDLPPRVRSALAGLLDATRAHFDAPLQRALDGLEQALFQLAERAGSNARQQEHFESLRRLRQRRAEVAPRFLRHVESSLAQVRAGAKSATARAVAVAKPAPLELVDPSVLEEDLALREIAGKAEVRNSQALHALAHRFGVLSGTPAWSGESMPLGPAQLLAAFRFALLDLDLGLENRVLANREFDRAVMLHAGGYYEALNAFLVAQRILPNLLWSTSRPRPDPVRAAASVHAAAFATPSTPTPVAGDTEDVELFETMRRLLGSRRRRGHGSAGTAPDSAVPASREDLQVLLGALQREPFAPASSDEPWRDGERLKRELFDRLRRAGPHGEALRLHNEDADTIELVGLLFDYIGANVPEGSGARALLGRLQVPVLRVALGDRTFFTRRSHPARELLNAIAETGAQWIDDGDSDPDLSAKMRLAVDGVSDGFDGDVEVFENLLFDLSRHMRLLARRAEVVERRHVEAAKGRDRLEVARATARGAIAQALREGEPAASVRALLEQGWTDVLALSALRQGGDSAEFRRRLVVAVRLARNTAAALADAELRGELEAGLRETGLHDDDRDRLLGQLSAAPGAMPGSAAAGDPRIEAPARSTLPLRPSVPAAKPEPIPLSAAEQAMLERLRQVPFGTWFVFTLNQQGASARRKLAWFSTVTKRCLFVNQRGARSEDRTLDQIARDMVRGQVRLEVPPRTSLIDRAWQAILETLSRQEAS